ncbi:MAG: HEAT repeat domain-containing protein, partial [Terriglobia bacterium]
GEARAEYYSDLIGAVVALHDPRNLPLLVQVSTEPDTQFNQELAAFGRSALPAVFENLGRLSQVRLSGSRLAIYEPQRAMGDILTKMMKLDQQKELKPPLTPSDYATIRQILRPLLASPNNSVRLYAAIALARAGDVRDSARFRETFMRFLEDPIPGARTIGLERMMSMTDVRSIPLAKVRELATSDPYHYRRGVLGDGPVVYPVREAARKVIKKFSEPSSPLAPE